MTDWRLSGNATFFGRQRDIFTEYQPDVPLETKIERVASVQGLSGIELKYPWDFEDVSRTARLVSDAGLALSAVNVDTKAAELFRYGALSANSRQARDDAVERLCAGMDIAAELGADIVTTCPLADGYDYAFEIDYAGAWERLVESCYRVAAHRADVRFVLEYQNGGMYAHSLVGNLGAALYACAQVGLPNIGVNLDVGHSFAAGETPAEAAALLASQDRLFYVHTDDNTGDGDWDMVSGSAHFWGWIELLHALIRLGYDGWFSADIAAKRASAVDLFGANARMLRGMTRLVERFGVERLAALAAQDGNSADIMGLLIDALAGA